MRRAWITWTRSRTSRDWWPGNGRPEAGWGLSRLGSYRACKSIKSSSRFREDREYCRFRWLQAEF